MWLETLALDPWARGHTWSAQPLAEKLKGFSVAVIGAGMGGLNVAVQLKHSGIPFTVLEKNSEVGGTWFENRYPGARVDSPSRTYTHTYGVDFPFPNPFCPQSENEKYFNWVADSFGDPRGHPVRHRSHVLYLGRGGQHLGDSSRTSGGFPDVEGEHGDQLRRFSGSTEYSDKSKVANISKVNFFTQLAGRLISTWRASAWQSSEAGVLDIR